jgi:hypothetical protein
MNASIPIEKAQPAPLSAWTAKFLLAGPAAAGLRPRGPEVDAEFVRVWGRFGENVAGAWRAHEGFLRAAAEEHGIRPMWPRGRFFAEAIVARRG